MQLKIKTFENYYCDALACALSEFLDLQNDCEEDLLLKKLSIDEAQVLCDYAVVKNMLAGVGKLYLKVPYPELGLNSLDKYHITGKEILSARLMSALTTKHFVGGRVELYIEDLIDYAEGALSEISDFCGKTDIGVMINLGRDLDEVGRAVNRYGKSPASILEDFGFLDRECYIYGLNFIDKDDQKLLAEYNPTLILSPRSDGEEGKGAINLYNFIYNRLKFGFSSGKCYNIDMLGEAKLANINTNNLMYETGLVKFNDLIKALEFKKGEEISISVQGMEENIFNERILLSDQPLKEEFSSLREKVIEIARKIKEFN